MGTHGVKAMEFTVLGQRLVATSFAYKTIATEAERVPATADIVEAKHYRGRLAVSAVSGRNVITRYIVMQRLSDDELDTAIQFEADKYIPFGIDEVMLDYQKIEDLESGQMRVLLVAVKRNIVDEHIRILSDIGLEPWTIDVEAFAIGNAFLEGNRSKIGSSTVALVDIGHAKTNIVVMSGAKTMFNRELYVGTTDMMETVSRNMEIDAGRVESFAREPGDDADALSEALAGRLDDLSNEISLSFEFFENEYDRSIESIWLSGGGSCIYDMSGEITSRLGKPAQLWDPLENVELRFGSDMVAVAKDIAGKLAVVAGLGTRVRKET